MDRLKYAYAAIVLIEAAVLVLRYRVDAPAPSDPLSIALGWVGLGSMVALLCYSFARRSRALRRFARLSYWLHFHIFLACQGCLAVLFHCWHLFGRETPVNPLNPAFLSGTATLIVFCSGLFGRYLYAFLPRSPDGVQMQSGDLGKSKALVRAEAWFRHWIVLHRPLAAMLYVLAIVHVVFSYMFSSALAR